MYSNNTCETKSYKIQRLLTLNEFLLGFQKQATMYKLKFLLQRNSPSLSLNMNNLRRQQSQGKYIPRCCWIDGTEAIYRYNIIMYRWLYFEMLPFISGFINMKKQLLFETFFEKNFYLACYRNYVVFKLSLIILNIDFIIQISSQCRYGRQ